MSPAPTYTHTGPHIAQDGRPVWRVVRLLPDSRHCAPGLPVAECLSERVAQAHAARMNNPAAGHHPEALCP